MTDPKITVFDKIPARTEITVLPADKPEEHMVGWQVHCYSGAKVYLLTELEVVEEPITDRAALTSGVSVAVPSFFGGFHHMVIKDDSKERLYAETLDGKLGAFIHFGLDERNCWVCTGLISCSILDAFAKGGAQ